MNHIPQAVASLRNTQNRFFIQLRREMPESDGTHDCQGAVKNTETRQEVKGSVEPRWMSPALNGIYVACCELCIYFWHKQNTASGSVAARPSEALDRCGCTTTVSLSVPACFI